MAMRTPIGRLRTCGVLIALWTAALGWTAAAWACPMCASNLPGGDGPTGVETGPTAVTAGGKPAISAATGQGDLARGFYLSILLMLAVPYSMAACGGAVLWWHLRRARQAVTILGDPAATPTAADDSSQTA